MFCSTALHQGASGVLDVSLYLPSFFLPLLIVFDCDLCWFHENVPALWGLLSESENKLL